MKRKTTVLASAARTVSWSVLLDADGAIGAQSLALVASARLRIQLNVTAASGTTPTLDLLVEDSLDGTNWNTIATFTQKTAAGRQVVDVTNPFASIVRFTYTIAGTTPSFTFGIVVAHD